MPRVDATLDRLKDIVNGNHAGERLAPERQLAAELQVSRGTLRRALEMLEAEGKIWRHVGQGTFIGTRPLSIGGADTPVTKVTNPAEVMEVRLILEPRMAALAALRATPADIARMQNCLRKGDGATSSDAYELWDGTLHKTIAESTRNTLLLAMFNAVNAVRGDRLWGQLKRATLTRPRQDNYSTHHRRLVAAIGDRDETTAERIMREHLDAVRHDLLSSRAA